MIWQEKGFIREKPNFKKEEWTRTHEEKIEIAKRKLMILNMDDVIEITGWSKGVVSKLFAHDEDFKAIKIAKPNQILLDSLKDYLSVRRVSR